MSTSNRIAYLGSCSKYVHSPNPIALSKSFVVWVGRRLELAELESNPNAVSNPSNNFNDGVSPGWPAAPTPEVFTRLNDTGLFRDAEWPCARSSANFVRTQIRGNFNRRIKVAMISLPGPGKDQHSIDLEHANPMDKADEPWRCLPAIARLHPQAAERNSTRVVSVDPSERCEGIEERCRKYPEGVRHHGIATTTRQALGIGRVA